MMKTTKCQFLLCRCQLCLSFSCAKPPLVVCFSLAPTHTDSHTIRRLTVIRSSQCEQVDRIGEANLARVLATMSVLGFSTPSFSFGTDVLLPVDSNQQLRDVLLSNTKALDRKRRTSSARDMLAVSALGKFNDVFVPEVRLVACVRVPLSVLLR